MSRSRKHRGKPGASGDADAVPRSAPGKRSASHKHYAGVQRKPVQRESAGDQAADAHADEHAHVHPQIEAEPGTDDSASATAPAERKTGDEIPATLRTRLFDKLGGSDAFKAVIKEIKDAGKDAFPIKWSARGGYHSRGEIFIDKTKNEAAWVATLAHEVVHLSTFVRGKAADAKSDNRADFVKNKMEDEINSQATSYVALLQIGETSAHAAGFKDFQKFVAKKHAADLASKKWDAIKTAALAWLEDKYKNEWVTSNTSENYYTYWGNYWDRMNPGT